MGKAIHTFSGNRADGKQALQLYRIAWFPEAIMQQEDLIIGTSWGLRGLSPVTAAATPCALVHPVAGPMPSPPCIQAAMQSS